MARYHPEDELLLEYAAGRTDWAVSICVAAHLHFCPSCREQVAKFNRIGGHCLEQADKVDVPEDALNSVMAMIRTESRGEKAPNPTKAAPAVKPAFQQLPPVIQKLIPDSGKVRWSFVTPALKAARLETGQDKYEVCFHRIKKGGTVAEHDHNGRELTLVLQGRFSDENGTYSVGDFLMKQPGETHRPTATLDQDCLCLSVQEAPVKLTGLVGRVINPFLRVRPG
ncbi:ChrR family anti-sigma-E factor [Marinimicrobium sp. ABcell2]|uniref:ChrR family anti-sigma-E factor n=1 Tax=Marinimicrobium sp. ABcell2 TaxID=3069751 RepID=UPI0027B141A7|nr:ChrR family anti-sigma-E factor [Marinimicrobium sp. ABcell2]MDQ2076804.1 ChrR family anti-sigma-E factor [Marinimicrobium sp. ABcell2]